MKVSVPKETRPGERRVALAPDTVKKLVASGLSVDVQSGAGLEAGFSDADFTAAGASVPADRASLLAGADVLACVNLPDPADIGRLRRGSAVIGFLRPLDEPESLRPLLDAGITAFAVELIPRTTRAQAMDALSSMATIAGYKAVLVAAARLPKMFPLLMTAAGTVPPAKVVVVGAGVAGLMAIATARRLGANVEAYDVRQAAGEEVRSLGARFLDVDLGGIQTQDAGGYALELSPEALQRGRDLVAKHARDADLVVTTAQVPGRKAPLMLDENAVNGMRPGAVIVDLAAPTGGNTAYTRPGENTVVNGVTILAPLNLAATVPLHASQLYARNVAAFLKLLVGEGGALGVNLNDDIVAGACATHGGQPVNPRVAALLAPAAPTGANR
ncbi:MAG TPA: NAD(P) transhydrogenase subunit alpha [Thermoanaerobaculia bacterium]|nr:NAD(P) transhydrogenase subunit alpha [Thermoanaerobaculia bacterium]